MGNAMILGQSGGGGKQKIDVSIAVSSTTTAIYVPDWETYFEVLKPYLVTVIYALTVNTNRFKIKTCFAVLRNSATMFTLPYSATSVNAFKLRASFVSGTFGNVASTNPGIVYNSGVNFNFAITDNLGNTPSDVVLLEAYLEEIDTEYA